MMLWNEKEKDLDGELDDAEEETVNVVAPAMVTAPTTVPMNAAASCILGPGTVFTGNIVSKDDVVLSGGLQGNLSTKGNVSLSGSLKGDLSVSSTTLSGGTVEGNITATELVILHINSKVKGNIKAKSVNLEAGASVIGDVTAETISMQAGAALQGKLCIGRIDLTGKGAKTPEVPAVEKEHLN